jgi:diguanylate cyclase (GGDEF)-like protein/PAS domain S-box-containing protein
MGLANLAGVDRYFRIQAQRSDASALQVALTHTAQHLDRDLHNGIAAIESLAGFMQASAIQPGPDRFDEFAAFLLTRHKSIRGLAYIDPNGIIRHFYPKRGNESAIGLDLKRRPAAPFVATAIRERRTTVNHPTRTVQGYLAVIARTPFYRDGRLAGLVQGVFDVSEVVAAAAASPDPRIDYELLDAEGRRFYGAESPLADPVSATVKVGDNHWQLKIGWISGPPGPAPALLGLLWIGGLLLLTSVLVLIRRTQMRELWLRTAVDEQTRSLHEREQLLRQVLDSLPVGVWITDKQGKIISGNPEGQRIWAGARYVGTDQYGEYKGWWADTGKPIAADEWALARAIRNGETSINEVINIECFDGTRKTILNSAVPIRADGGEITGAIVVNQDITERKRAEDALRESEEILANAQEMTHLGSWKWRVASGEVTWSDEMYRIYGLSPDAGEITFERAMACTHPDDRANVAGQVQAMLDGKEVDYYECRVVRPDGVERWVLARSVVRRDAEQKPVEVIGTVQDITERKLAEQQLRESEARFRTLSEVAFEGIFIHDQGRIVDCNPTFAAMLGYEIEEIRKLTVFQLVVPAQHELVRRSMRERYEIPLELTAVRKDGSTFTVEVFGKPLDYHGRTLRVASVRDTTARLRAETQMRKLSSALEQTADTVMITNRAGVIEYVNPGFENTTGYSRAEAVGQTPSLVKSGKQGAGFYKKLWETILAGEVFSEVFVNRRKDGSLYYEEKTITPLKDAAGEIASFVATGKDVTERMQTQERLQHMAQHDALTELPNRLLFMDRLKQALARARWHERLVAVLFVDMDRFKTINDTLGHEAGDRLLQALAVRFTSSVRDGDTVARFGGDEFVILLDDVGSEKDIGAVAHKVLEALAPPFAIDGQSLYVTASIGVSLYPNDGEDSGTLLKNADIAMYRAKDLGKNNYQFYSADMSARAFERLTLESSLRHAIERHEFRLHYQPQIDTASGAIIGVEALLRWQHPDFGLVAPAEFIPLLEETGLIVPVGEWVFHTACEQLRAWRAAGWPTLRLAVNLSPRQFQASGLARMVERGLATAGCDPGLIELEITENVILRHTAATLETLEALHALGVRLAIDDFGIGYSSLSYLRRYAIDTLKIDRSFVHDVPTDADDSALASAIVVLAQSLKLDVIAEGVETEAQRDFLRERGCRVMQGYLFSRPVPAEEFARLLAERNHK